MTEPTSTDRRRLRRRTLTVALATALVVAPATAFATGGFTDVKSSDFFSDAVGWMADNGVTAGCNPNASPPNTKYCPGDFVTRGQMAVFLERLDSKNVFLRPGEINTDGADAETLDGKDSTAFLLKTQKAADADKLDGKDSSAFLGKTEKAADADKLDGVNGADYATDADVASALADLDAFIPIATFAVAQGTIVNSSHRAPMTAAPTITGSNGTFEVDLPGFDFGGLDTIVCTPFAHDLYVWAWWSFDFNLLVKLQEVDGTLADDADSEDDFSCAVYDN